MSLRDEVLQRIEEFLQDEATREAISDAVVNCFCPLDDLCASQTIAALARGDATPAQQKGAAVHLLRQAIETAQVTEYVNNILGDMLMRAPSNLSHREH